MECKGSYHSLSSLILNQKVSAGLPWAYKQSFCEKQKSELEEKMQICESSLKEKESVIEELEKDKKSKETKVSKLSMIINQHSKLFAD